MSPRFRLAFAASTAFAFYAVTGHTQDFPSKPIRIVTSGVGGGGDFASRQIAQGIAGPLGQPVIVENRGGTSGPGEAVSKAPPDGHTLLVHGSTFWIGALLQKTPYDPATDFLPISLLSRQPNVLVVHPALPIRSVRDLIALAKARPGEINYASGETGGSNHLAGALFASLASIKIVRIPYKTTATAITDLIAGQVQLTFSNPTLVLPHVKSGRLRALAVTTVEQSPLVPGVPTMIAAGLPGFESAQMSGLFAPARTPSQVIARLNQETVRFLKAPEVRTRFLASGVEPLGSSPDELAGAMRSEVARMGKLIKETGIRADE